MKKFMQSVTKILSNKRSLFIYLLAFAVIGTAYLISTQAATISYDIEAESGQTQSPAVQVSDATASSGSAIKFGSATGDATSPIPGYTLKWSDEFNGTAVDSAKWNVPNNSNFGSGSNEDQCYQVGNTLVSGGFLNLIAKKQTVTTCPVNPDGYGTKDNYFWTSGMVSTSGKEGPLKYSFTQGYAEAKMKVPVGNAYWPAFWLVGTGVAGQDPGWPAYGEFDVMETYGSIPDVTTGTIHYACPGHCQTRPNFYNLALRDYGTKGTTSPNIGVTNDWHTYGLLWTDTRITWYVDGKSFLYFERADNTIHKVDANGNSISSQSHAAPTTDFWSIPHSFRLNLAIGGSGPTYWGYNGRESSTSSSYDDGNLAGTVPGTLQVDYVRVWQK